MIEKYEDLADRIAGDFPPMTGPDIATLRWLDEHPDQVPGRTITESDLSEAVENSSRWTDEGFGRDVLSHFGIEVVPDPEPTNAEKLRKVLDTFEVDEQNLDEVAELLDKAGVRAPGGDE